MKKLRGPLSRHLENEVDAAVVDRVGERLRARSPSRRAFVAVGVTIAAAAIALRIATGPTLPGELTLASGEPLVTLGADEEQIATLSDGTRLELAPGARVERVRNDRAQLVLRQSAGRVRYEVAPQGARRFVIESGPASIEVVGTAFVVERVTRAEREEVSITVEHGVVVVRSEHIVDRVARLEAGALLLVTDPTYAPSEPLTVRPIEPAHTPDTPRARPEPDRATRPLAVTGSERTGRTTPPVQPPDVGEADMIDDGQDVERDRDLLAEADGLRTQGRLSEARDRLPEPDRATDPLAVTGSERAGRTTPPVQPHDVGEADVIDDGQDVERDRDLLAEADGLRIQGRLSEARDRLEVVIAGGRAPHAALAAYSLGRLLDEGGEPAAAERAFERALELGLSSALAGAGWSRLAALRGARGDLDGARRAALRALELGVTHADRARAERWL